MALIERTNVEALIPEDAQREIVAEVAQMSAAMQLMRRLPNMTRGRRRLPVLDALPYAYFVGGTPGGTATTYGDGMKKTSNIEWKDKYITAEEIAVIMPVAISTLEDADYDIWGEARPFIAEAFGKAFDAAVFHGVNAPLTWAQDIVTAATSAGNVITEGAGTDLYDEIMGETGLIAMLEEDGYFCNGYVGALNLRGKLRGLRDSVTGLPLFRNAMDGMQAQSQYVVDGQPMLFPTNGSVDPTEFTMIAGDWTKAVYSIRTDLTYKVLDQAVIQDVDTGDIIYNLAQQDMVALRVYMRLGWQVPNPVNPIQPLETNRYPFAVLLPNTSP